MQAELVFTHTESIKKCCGFFYNISFFLIEKKFIRPKKKPETVSLLAESGFVFALFSLSFFSFHCYVPHPFART